MSHILDPVARPATPSPPWGPAEPVQVRALSRNSLGLERDPIRAVHLGLGAFHRAHQAWYTDAANAASAEKWGIAAFTGRRPDEARKLAAQDGLYVLVTRSPTGDTAQVITSISAVHDGSDVDAWMGYFADPRMTVVTMTVTEAGYCLDQRGRLDMSMPAIRADLAALLDDTPSPMLTAPGKLVQGLTARAPAGAPLTIVSCDNVPKNGMVTRAAVLGLCAAVDPSLAAWAEANVTFPDTMVDRITPRSTEADIEMVATQFGWHDAAPVITEPFSEWVIEARGDERMPDWAGAGARLVADVAPFERRKLVLLNGGHSLLAYAGMVRGHETVSDAVSDPLCLRWLNEWWDEASGQLGFSSEELAVYREALLARFANPRIRHLLSQIGTDGSQKLPARIGGVIEDHRAAGIMPIAGARVIAAWIASLRNPSITPMDVDPAVAIQAARSDREAAKAAARRVAPSLEEDRAFIDCVVRSIAEFRKVTPPAVAPTGHDKLVDNFRQSVAE
ncbi:MAG: Mannitol dehydrogenase domain [Rhodoglobus sp.]|nr:Mannitol dehydrogenase domain [Rhodoglobus sp.]